MRLPVTNIQRFSVHDGPGIRTTVFFKGCPLRCLWCHNPETQESRDQILYAAQKCIGCGACAAQCPTGAHRLEPDGHRFYAAFCTGCLRCTAVCPSGAVQAASQPMSPEEIFEVVMRDRAFYGRSGGLTLSGGEPLLHPEGCRDLLQMARAAGLTTAIETSGFFDGNTIPELAPLTDWFLWDYKDSDPVRHRMNTGGDPAVMLQNLRRLDEEETRIQLRCILIRGINMDVQHYKAIAELAGSLRHGAGVHIFPYHALGGSKSEQLGRGDNGRREWIPSPEELDDAGRQLTALGVRLV